MLVSVRCIFYGAGIHQCLLHGSITFVLRFQYAEKYIKLLERRVQYQNTILKETLYNCEVCIRETICVNLTVSVLKGCDLLSITCRFHGSRATKRRRVRLLCGLFHSGGHTLRVYGCQGALQDPRRESKYDSFLFIYLYIILLRGLPALSVMKCLNLPLLNQCNDTYFKISTLFSAIL